MENYQLIQKVGAGSFGVVWKAINKKSNEVVAIKKLKEKNNSSWEQCKNLREVKSLKKMNHPNIIKLKGMIREHKTLYLVLEYMPLDLRELMKQRENNFSEDEIRNWCFQVFQALKHMHQRGYIHRDLKPSNLLVSENVIKLADFGMVREINCLPPYTDCVTTRLYRAPEVMLKSYIYTPKVDMWAMGAIIAELLTFRPLCEASGTTEAHQMFKICSVLGSPSEESWADGLRLARAINYKFPELRGVNLSELIPSASADAISLIELLCSWDPYKRPMAAEALQHPFFRSCFPVPPSLDCGEALTKQELEIDGSFKTLRKLGGWFRTRV